MTVLGLWSICSYYVVCHAGEVLSCAVLSYEVQLTLRALQVSQACCAEKPLTQLY